MSEEERRKVQLRKVKGGGREGGKHERNERKNKKAEVKVSQSEKLPQTRWGKRERLA